MSDDAYGKIGVAIGVVSFFGLVTYAVCVAWIYGGWLAGIPVSCIAGLLTASIITGDKP